MRRVLATICVSSFMVLLCVPLSLAQTSRGQLNGRITDTSGAVIPGAQIGTTNPATGVKLETVANEAGQYVMSLPFATYDIRVTAPGFAPQVTTGVLVSTASTTTINVELQVEAVAEEVTVSVAATELFSGPHSTPSAKGLPGPPARCRPCRLPPCDKEIFPPLEISSTTSKTGSAIRRVKFGAGLSRTT